MSFIALVWISYKALTCPEGTYHLVISHSFRLLFESQRLLGDRLSFRCRWGRSGSGWNVRNLNGKGKLLEGCGRLRARRFAGRISCCRLVMGCGYIFVLCMPQAGCSFMTNHLFNWYSEIGKYLYLDSFQSNNYI